MNDLFYYGCWCDVACKQLSVCVLFLKTVWRNFSCSRLTSTSTKGKQTSFSISIAKLMCTQILSVYMIQEISQCFHFMCTYYENVVHVAVAAAELLPIHSYGLLLPNVAIEILVITNDHGSSTILPLICLPNPPFHKIQSLWHQSFNQQ